MRGIRSNLKLFIGLALCLGLAGACGKKDEKSDTAAANTAAGAAPAAAATFTCTKAGEWCMEYSGDALRLGEAALQGACGAMSGAFAPGKCYTAKSLGSCDLSKGQVKTYYASAENNAESVKSDCDLHDGKLSPAAP